MRSISYLSLNPSRRLAAWFDEQVAAASSDVIMSFERTRFAPGDEPEAFTTNVCEKFLDGAHELCPGWVKFDPARMDSPTATENDIVFCSCACHAKPQA
jgi:hypothetical protein